MLCLFLATPFFVALVLLALCAAAVPSSAERARDDAAQARALAAIRDAGERGLWG